MTVRRGWFSIQMFCPHIKDQILVVDGVRLNMDHYLKVLRAKYVHDPTMIRLNWTLDSGPTRTNTTSTPLQGVSK